MNPKELAEQFCQLNAGQQAQFLNQVATIFHSWGDEREKFQINAIMRGSGLTYGKIWIEEMYENRRILP